MRRTARANSEFDGINYERLYQDLKNPHKQKIRDKWLREYLSIKEDSKNLSRKVVFRVSSEDYLSLVEIAESMEMKISDYIRYKLFLVEDSHPIDEK